MSNSTGRVQGYREDCRVLERPSRSRMHACNAITISPCYIRCWIRYTNLQSLGKWLDHRGTVCSQARLCWAAQCIEMHVGGYIYSHGQYSHSPKSCSNNNHGVGFLPMPISSLPVMCRSTISNQHPQTQSRHNQMLHTRWYSMSNYRTKAKRRILLVCSSSRCLV